MLLHVNIRNKVEAAQNCWVQERKWRVSVPVKRGSESESLPQGRRPPCQDVLRCSEDRVARTSSEADTDLN